MLSWVLVNLRALARLRWCAWEPCRTACAENGSSSCLLPTGQVSESHRCEGSAELCADEAAGGTAAARCTHQVRMLGAENKELSTWPRTVSRFLGQPVTIHAWQMLCKILQATALPFPTLNLHLRHCVGIRAVGGAVAVGQVMRFVLCMGVWTFPDRASLLVEAHTCITDTCIDHATASPTQQPLRARPNQ